MVTKKEHHFAAGLRFNRDQFEAFIEKVRSLFPPGGTFLRIEISFDDKHGDFSSPEALFEEELPKAIYDVKFFVLSRSKNPSYSFDLRRFSNVEITASSEDAVWASGVIDQIRTYLKQFEFAGRNPDFPNAPPSVILYPHEFSGDSRTKPTAIDSSPAHVSQVTSIEDLSDSDLRMAVLHDVYSHFRETNEPTSVVGIIHRLQVADSEPAKRAISNAVKFLTESGAIQTRELKTISATYNMFMILGITPNAIRLIEASTKANSALSEEARGVKISKSSKVFIAHGHDHATRDAISTYLYGLHLEPIVLENKANFGSQTLINKFEKHAGEIGFAVVILSPDDVGGAKGADTQKPRARQNVVFELGYLIAKLGLDRVTVIRTDEAIENPSDIAGILYVLFDSYGGWKKKIDMELQAAGLIT